MPGLSRHFDRRAKEILTQFPDVSGFRWLALQLNGTPFQGCYLSSRACRSVNAVKPDRCDQNRRCDSENRSSDSRPSSPSVFYTCNSFRTTATVSPTAGYFSIASSTRARSISVQVSEA